MMFLKAKRSGVLFKSLMAVVLSASVSNVNAKPIEFVVSSNVADKTYLNNQQSGVYQLTLDSTKPADYQLELLFANPSPSYLYVEKSGKILVSTGDSQAGVAIYDKNEQGQYQLLNQLMGLGNNACHISYNSAQNLISLAFYSSPFAKLVSYNAQTQDLSQLHQFTHTGSSVTERQTEPHPHWSGWSPEGKFLYAIDLGIDEVKQYFYQNEQWNMRTAATLDAGDGPRHIAFHPTLNQVYLLNELSNTLVVFEQNLTSGKLARKQKVSTLSAGFKAHSQASAIRISNDGRFVYVSNRGEDTIAVFKVLADGQVKHIQSATSGGHWPRDFNFSIDQDFILVANTRGDALSLLARDAQTGLLTDTGHTYPIATPKFVEAAYF
ncbi:lactonase family protein [Catenovulum sp. 2E275]|uniref:lactonase family protein n=1 Tax=Catenovulum sp. 2E275 TaxID=2980497 RepID=UPI0021D152E6|nr:lactonase family protein [Catenovulum sp. 2E275]MCU4677266.1 lactonase family protein [Catenovulum sp. 2E275]